MESPESGELLFEASTYESYIPLQAWFVDPWAAIDERASTATLSETWLSYDGSLINEWNALGKLSGVGILDHKLPWVVIASGRAEQCRSPQVSSRRPYHTCLLSAI